MPKTLIPQQDPKERIKNFDEVALGYTPEQAMQEAKRCIGCKKPNCVKGCPVEIDIPAFISEITAGNFKQAFAILQHKNFLPAVCGRVCPQETQCEQLCILSKKDEPVAIGRLERFVADWARENNHSALDGEKIAAQIEAAKNIKAKHKVGIVGSGPAGLTAAVYLALQGYGVTIFESLHAVGGVMRYGIPEFRLPKGIVDYELEAIKEIGVEIKVNFVAGKTATIDELRQEGYKAFFLGTGAGLPYFLGIPGENLSGVYSANEFLTRTNLMKAYKFPEYDTPIVVGNRVAVIGAGNVSMDSARCAKRLGAKEVHIVYRRTAAEMPARAEEIEHAKEEGIIFDLLVGPKKVTGDDKGWVKGLECIKNELGEPDASGRRRPVPIEGSEYTEEFDTVICAIGQGPNPLLLTSIPELKLNKKGYIDTDDAGATSIPGVYAGGDIVTGTATVIDAMGAGRRAARAMNAYVKRSSP